MPIAYANGNTYTYSEKTEVVYGIKNTTVTILQFLYNSIVKLNICVDSAWPLIIIQIDFFRKAFLDLKGRGVKSRIITEITSNNLLYCKELMRIVELRHMDGFKSNFGVNEMNYITFAKLQEKQLLQQVIYSNVKEFIGQHHYLFETLWDRSIPAEQKIREIEEGIESYESKILYGSEIITEALAGFYNRVDKHCDGYGATNGRPIVLGSKGLNKILINLKNKGARLRHITEITKDNIRYCKQIMEIVELRHMDGVRGGMAVSDTEYITTANTRDSKIIPHLFYSNGRQIVEQQQHIFETLWDRSIPAEQKIREIEEGIEPDVIEVINNPSKSKDLFLNFLKSATKEILVIIPSYNQFVSIEKLGVIELAKEAIEVHNIRVKMMVPSHKSIEQTIVHLKQNDRNDDNIDLRYIEQTTTNTAENKTTILIVDRKVSLVIELKDDYKDTFEEAIGFSIYSNSQTAVSSYVAIFDNLWVQTELYQQLKESHKRLKLQEMQTEFVNIAAHELRTPIQPILGLSEILQSKIKDNEQCDLIDIISRNAKRLKHLTDNILDITKIESQSLQLKKERFDLNEAIMNVLAEYQSPVKKANNVKTIFTSKDNLFVKADKGRLTQVISNLLNNAFKFTQEGSIIILAKRVNHSVNVSIKDTGTGIDPEILPVLFMKFVTKKSSSGTGLGLYISKSIIEAHGGRIWAENNKDGKGATFAFSIPLIS
jgi:two-component system sensor histidine kinase VicK